MNTPRPLTAQTRSKSATDSSVIGAIRPSMPALLKNRSIRPNSATAAATYPSTSDSTDTSATTARPPSLAAAASSAAASRSTSTSRAPSSASRDATASPNPLAAPVITATCPVEPIP